MSSLATAVPWPQQAVAAFSRLCRHKESFLDPSLFDDYISKLHLDRTKQIWWEMWNAVRETSAYGVFLQESNHGAKWKEIESCLQEKVFWHFCWQFHNETLVFWWWSRLCHAPQALQFWLPKRIMPPAPLCVVMRLSSTLTRFSGPDTFRGTLKGLWPHSGFSTVILSEIYSCF